MSYSPVFSSNTCSTPNYFEWDICRNNIDHDTLSNLPSSVSEEAQLLQQLAGHLKGTTDTWHSLQMGSALVTNKKNRNHNSVDPKMFVCLRWQTHSAIFFSGKCSINSTLMAIHGHHRHHPYHRHPEVIAMVYLGDKLGLYKHMSTRGSTWTASRCFLGSFAKNTVMLGIHRKDRGLCGFASDWCSFPFFGGVVFFFQIFLCVGDCVW